MLTSKQKHQLASGLAHVLHAEERAEYIRAAIERGDVFTAAEDCQRLIDELSDAKAPLAALDMAVNPGRSTTCEHCGKTIKTIKQGPYCRACQRDFADHEIENEWTWTGPR